MRPRRLNGYKRISQITEEKLIEVCGDRSRANDRLADVTPRHKNIRGRNDTFYTWPYNIINT